MMYKILKTMLDPYPHRTFALRFVKNLKIGSYSQRLTIGAVERPHYGYCIYHAAKLAVSLGIEEISVLEFGVAGGNGLINLEYHSNEIEKILPVKIRIFGFDLESGLPSCVDYRDLPYRFAPGSYRMDIQALEKRLKKSTLVIGDVKDTVMGFFEEYHPSPIGAIVIDLDLYSSTRNALRIFDCEERYLLPRIYCYFDDVLGTEAELYNDFVGERLAIREFNMSHEQKKICKPYHFSKRKVGEPWHYNIFIYHDFSHGRYNDFVGTDVNNDLSLE